MSRETIYALSSGSPPAAISVIRVSGADAHKAAEKLAGSLPAARQAAVRELRRADGELLDEALVLRFDSPASATGENLVEFHCHGGRAIVAAVLGELAAIAGLRQAEPGEFTRRAFENGRIDLTEAEGLADLLEAETESQRRAALLLAEGGLKQRIEQWQRRLLDLSARAEAAIDYVDDDSVDSDPALTCDCSRLAEELRQWLARPRAEPLREGIRVVIAGPPNAGKSSLLNAIAGFERAIVTDVPGTTRDHVDVPMAIAGIPIRLTDTAGLRASGELAEQIGVERSRALMDIADVLLWLGAAEDAPGHPSLIQVHAKADRPGRKIAPPGSMAVSVKTGAGMRELLDRIVVLARVHLPAEGELALNRRQAAHVEEALSALEGVESEPDLVIVAESLRSARSAFDRLTGRAGVEEVLDTLFGRFCLGK